MISNDLKENLSEILKEIEDYILKTYGEHYATGEIQTIDIWEKNGSILTSCRDTAEKYLDRYGKKAGYNRKDLLKAIHYILFMMVASKEPLAAPEG